MIFWWFNLEKQSRAIIFGSQLMQKKVLAF